MRLFSFWHIQSKLAFDKIEGYIDLKDIVRRALDSDENYNLLLVGTPASSKTLFLQGILEIRKDGVYFDCSNATNRILVAIFSRNAKSMPEKAVNIEVSIRMRGGIRY
jgi:hypothetical protein